MKMDFDTLEEKAEEEACKGLIFRGRVSTWFDGNSLHSKKSLNLLKRKSCKGCKYCEWINEFLQEDVGNNSQENVLEDIVDGKMYEIVFETSRDYESGYDDIDGWHLKEV